MPDSDPQTFNWHYDGGALDDENLEVRGRKFFFLLVLFVIVLFSTALFLYVRWICHPDSFSTIRRGHAPARSSPSWQGLEPETIKKLPIVLHQASKDQDSACECCICLSAFRDGEKLKKLPGCEHCFHCECVDKWLMNHSSCPLCRASLKLDVDSSFSFPAILIQEPPVRHP
ncbi:hypothetical protein RIF29_17550 [Crotalaria pallida]|uniref:RING-type E3 ubiquitin transferase n=1 Tax=Crotalaria pallida TaxID=3830 RepID=A0AAN9FJJ1_CROPI